MSQLVLRSASARLLQMDTENRPKLALTTWMVESGHLRKIIYYIRILYINHILTKSISVVERELRLTIIGKVIFWSNGFKWKIPI